MSIVLFSTKILAESEAPRQSCDFPPFRTCLLACLLAACLLAATLDTKEGYKTKTGSTSSGTPTLTCARARVCTLGQSPVSWADGGGLQVAVLHCSGSTASLSPTVCLTPTSSVSACVHCVHIAQGLGFPGFGANTLSSKSPKNAVPWRPVECTLLGSDRMLERILEYVGVQCVCMQYHGWVGGFLAPPQCTLPAHAAPETHFVTVTPLCIPHSTIRPPPPPPHASHSPSQQNSAISFLLHPTIPLPVHFRISGPVQCNSSTC